MDKFLETVMNFINENTTLLIVICVFLIFVLIGYLIDNSIKTRKLEKQMITNPDEEVEEHKEEKKEKSKGKKENKIDPDTEIDLDFRTEEEKKGIDPNTEINLDFRTEEEKNSIDPDTEINLDFRTEEEKANEGPVVTEIPSEPISNEVTVDPAINDLLLRDFVNNGPVEVETDSDISINPIDNIASINNDEEEVEDSEEKEDNESLYKNDKKLSDIFKKKESKPVEEPRDPSDELDSILKKLNEEADSKDTTIEETQDFTNMF